MTQPMTETKSDANRDVYEAQAAAYDSQRSQALFEARWLARFASCLKPGGRVLDLGCGSGRPIAAWFKAEGFRVTGLDWADAMLAIARDRWPEGDWRKGDMRSFELGETFDGLIAWDSFFHLTMDEQRSCLPRMARHLAPGGSLLVTVGPRAGEAYGAVGGQEVYHASLSPAEYARVLEDSGMRLTGFLAEDPETDKHTVLMARKD
ncbi:class I SAM-dependent DNA methyltransferase [Roseobacteraceae bacterium S113]